MKNYTAITASYLGANGLTRIHVTDAATGTKVLRYVTSSQLKVIRRSGRNVIIAA